MQTRASNSELDYSDLANWSTPDWENIDIHQFIYANYRRYVSITASIIGRQNMTADAYDVLPSIFLDRGFKPMQSVHARHIDATGQRRNQLMLGTLKEIAKHRVCEAVVKEFPFTESLDQHANQLESDDTSSAANEDILPTYGNAIMGQLAITHSEILVDPDCLQKEVIEKEVEHELETSIMLELVKPMLTNNQFRHIWARTVEQKTVEEISAETGKTISNTRITLRNARLRFHKLLTEEQGKDNAQYVSKRFAETWND